MHYTSFFGSKHVYCTSCRDADQFRGLVWPQLPTVTTLECSVANQRDDHVHSHDDLLELFPVADIFPNLKSITIMMDWRECVHCGPMDGKAIGAKAGPEQTRYLQCLDQFLEPITRYVPSSVTAEQFVNQMWQLSSAIAY